MPKLHWDVSQGSGRWMAMRSVIPTASNFSEIITPAKGEPSASRWKYAVRIIAARMLNWQPDSLDKIAHIAAGKEQEPQAVAQLEILRGIETKAIGFVTSDDGRFGASPDRVVMAGEQVNIAIECKCPTIPTHFEYLLLGHGNDYRTQVQGQLYVCDADKAIFHSFNSRMPPHTVDTGRDESFIKKLSDALNRFSDELEELYLKAQALGSYEAFPSLLTPVEAEYAQELADDERLAKMEGYIRT